MINLILLSSLVSLLTLGILFLQRISPQKLRIPSYFLGVKSEHRMSQVRTKPPFWWEVLALIIFTLGAGLAYYSQQDNTPESKNKGDGLVWFDPTISHVHALRSSGAARDYILESLKELRLTEYVFIELNFKTSGDGIPRPSYELKRVPAAKLEEHILAHLGAPSALSQPLDARQLALSLEKNYATDLKNSSITLVSDAQAETIRPLSLLSATFRSVNFIKTPTANGEKQSAIQRTPLVPEELAQMWSSTTNSSTQESLLSTPQLVRLNDNLAAAIPRQARPSLFLEEYELIDGSNAQAPRYSLISSQDGDGGSDGSLSDRSHQALITTCTLSVAGPSELDGLSDLRAYAQFFNMPVRPLACRSTESSSSSQGGDHADPWKYRRASIWVVPVSESVAGELFQQGLYWIPEGFSPEHDALVYIADTRLAGIEGWMESLSVQLEKNQPTVNLPLLPLPPAQLTFPWDLQNSGKTPRAKPIALSPSKSKATLLTAADGTPLAYAMSVRPPVVYLRTGGAAPNGELGRWGKWAGLWSILTNQLRNVSPTLTKVQLKTPNDWSQWFEDQKRLQNPNLRYFMDGQNLKAQVINNPSALMPTPALYIRERDDQMILFEPPATEKLSEPLTLTEIEQLFPSNSKAVKIENQEQGKASFAQWFGGILALAAAVLLWVLQSQKKRVRVDQVAVFILSILAPLSLLNSQIAFAQGTRRLPFDARTLRSIENRPATTTFPFRIGWCDATIPEPVKKRYTQLQTLLASRGTIDLPRELTAGACRLGASEIWWTSSLEALQAAPVTQHIRTGGFVIAEGISLRQTPEWMLNSADPSIGLTWESPKRRGLLYRSFYLLSSFDGCTPERTLILTLRKKANAQSPMGIVTPARFLTNASEGMDCFVGDDDYRSRSFVNLMYSMLTTDYKEDQMQLPEILNRVRNLGLEP